MNRESRARYGYCLPTMVNALQADAGIAMERQRLAAVKDTPALSGQTGVARGEL